MGFRMSTVKVSSKFQVVIPRELREQLGIRAGMRLHAVGHGGHIAFIPMRSLKQARGFLRGIRTDVPRDPDRE